MRYASSQCADIPLAFYVLATVALITRAFETPSERLPWLLAGVSAGLAAWTKNEGMLFLVTCFAVVAIRSFCVADRDGWKYLGSLVAGASPMLLAVMLLKSITPGNDLVQAATLQSLLDAIGNETRLNAVFARIGRELWFGGASTIGVLPLVAAFTAVAGVRTNSNPGPLIGLATSGLLIVGYGAFYVMTPHNLAWHMNTSLDRVMLHAFPALVWCAMMMAKEESMTRS